MVDEIRIYVEGGGDGKNTKAVFHEGMSRFLIELRQMAQAKKTKWKIIVCGSRSSTFRDFCNGNKSNPKATNILLVDSESPVTGSTCSQHLDQQDKWNMSGINGDYVHLMVQVMESWIIADVDALAAYYGNGFNRNAVPGNSNVEAIPKTSIESALNNATKSTKKGKYHKIRHGPDILGQLSVPLVRSKAEHCDKLFNCIKALINPTA